MRNGRQRMCSGRCSSLRAATSTAMSPIRNRVDRALGRRPPSAADHALARRQPPSAPQLAGHYRSRPGS
uniref:Uncharacterized protein n=1 Tax=Oryza brachyantha TaxID=4533 RepID=J3L8H2_ORYBR